MDRGICNINGVIGQMIGENGKVITPFVTYLDVVSQCERQKNITHLDVYITTPGGLMEEGEDIVQYLESLKTKGITVHTHAKKEVCSFGADILLCGQERFIDENARLMIHNPWVSLKEGDASIIEAYAKELRKLESESIQKYADKTGADANVLKTLMKKDTFLTPQQAVDLGFATQISKNVQLEAVAFSRKFNTNLNNEKMSKETLTKAEAETMLDKMFDSIKQLFAPKQVKVIQDAAGVEITFPDLDPEDIPAIGDKAVVENIAANQEHVMPSGETYVFEAGVLTAIKAKEEDPKEESPELVQALEEVAQLKKQLKQIEQEKADLQTTVDKSKTVIDSIKEDIIQVKKSIKSGFEFEDPEGPNYNKKPKTRQLFKSEEK